MDYQVTLNLTIDYIFDHMISILIRSFELKSEELYSFQNGTSSSMSELVVSQNETV